MACSAATGAPPAASPGCGLMLSMQSTHMLEAADSLMDVAPKQLAGVGCLPPSLLHTAYTALLCLLRCILTSRCHACARSLQVITSFSKQQGRVTSPWVEVGGVQWRLKVGWGRGVGTIRTLALVLLQARRGGPVDTAWQPVLPHSIFQYTCFLLRS